MARRNINLGSSVVAFTLAQVFAAAFLFDAILVWKSRMHELEPRSVFLAALGITIALAAVGVLRRRPWAVTFLAICVSMIDVFLAVIMIYAAIIQEGKFFAIFTLWFAVGAALLWGLCTFEYVARSKPRPQLRAFPVVQR